MDPDTSDERLRIGDAHVHLFNGADLPVAGFFRNVLVPNFIPNWPKIALALIDMATTVLKAKAKTASDELGDLGASLAPQDELSPLEFAEAVAERAEQTMSERRAAAAPDALGNVGDSYNELAKLIAVETARQSNRPGPTLLDLESATSAEPLTVDRKTLAKIAAEGAEVVKSGAPVESFFLGRSPADIWALIKWAFRMTHSRSAHVREYVAAMQGKEARPEFLINLLVDYDDWLDDAPKPGSGHGEQVRFWTKYARLNEDRLQIHTFVGYDPLKHAIERRDSGGTSAYFDERKNWLLADASKDSRVAGLKLYPPMGFRAWENKPLPDVGRAAAIARKLWNGPVEDLAKALDSALDMMFDFATQGDIPLLAHAAASNEAFEGAGENARPKHWLDRAKRLPPGAGKSPLRICLAHFDAKSADDSVKDILALNLAGNSNIYFDVAFDEEIFEPGEARKLLDVMQQLCTPDPRAADYFMFGTDWIMLAQLRHSERYLEIFDEAVRDHPFWQSKRDKLLRSNLRSFLKLA